MYFIYFIKIHYRNFQPFIFWECNLSKISIVFSFCSSFSFSAKTRNPFEHIIREVQMALGVYYGKHMRNHSVVHSLLEETKMEKSRERKEKLLCVCVWDDGILCAVKFLLQFLDFVFISQQQRLVGCVLVHRCNILHKFCSGK